MVFSTHGIVVWCSGQDSFLGIVHLGIAPDQLHLCTVIIYELQQDVMHHDVYVILGYWNNLEVL